MECFVSSFWGRTSWNVCFGSSFWRELHGMFCEFILGENFMECMFWEFILERTSWNVLWVHFGGELNVCFGSSFWRELHGMFCSLKHAWLLDGIINYEKTREQQSSFSFGPTFWRMFTRYYYYYMSSFFWELQTTFPNFLNCCCCLLVPTCHKEGSPWRGRRTIILTDAGAHIVCTFKHLDCRTCCISWQGLFFLFFSPSILWYKKIWQIFPETWQN